MHFGIGQVPKAPTDDRFVKIFVFFAISLGRREPFFAKNNHFIAQREAGGEAGEAGDGAGEAGDEAGGKA